MGRYGKAKGHWYIQKRIKGKLCRFAYGQDLAVAHKVSEKLTELTDKYPGDEARIRCELAKITWAVGANVILPKEERSQSLIRKRSNTRWKVRKEIMGKKCTFASGRISSKGLAAARRVAAKVAVLHMMYPDDAERIRHELTEHVSESGVTLTVNRLRHKLR